MPIESNGHTSEYNKIIQEILAGYPPELREKSGFGKGLEEGARIISTRVNSLALDTNKLAQQLQSPNVIVALEIWVELSSYTEEILDAKVNKLNYSPNGLKTRRSANGTMVCIDAFVSIPPPRQYVEAYIDITLRGKDKNIIGQKKQLVYVSVEGKVTQKLRVKAGLPKHIVKRCSCDDGCDLIWGQKVDCDFKKRVVKMAANLGLPTENNLGANWLMAVMALETSRTFSPSKKNSLGYVGLVQFGDDACIDLKISKEELLKMSALEQLEYVEKLLLMEKKRNKGIPSKKYDTLTDLYLAILCPVASGYGYDRDHVVYSGDEYMANPSFFLEEGEAPDGLPEGKTYIWEVTQQIQSYYDEGEKYRCYEQ